jgi:hypothetical protein
MTISTHVKEKEMLEWAGEAAELVKKHSRDSEPAERKKQLQRSFARPKARQAQDDR